MVIESGKEGARGLSNSDRRKYPRYLVEIPLDCTHIDTENVLTGLTANASEGGVMTFIGERVEVGDILNMTLFFRLGYSLASMETRSVVIWRDDVWREYWDNYRYGLRFLETDPKELEKLRNLLENSERQETLYIPTGRVGAMEDKRLF